MNSSKFMDKQIMGLQGSQSGGELFDLMNPQEDHQIDGAGVMKKEEIVPSYDFHLTRNLGPSSPMNTSSLDGARPSWGSADSKLASASLKYAGILEPHEVSKVTPEKEKGAYDVTTVAEIDCTVKKYADNLLHALEGVSSRLSQLESRTRHLESSVDELKLSIGNNNGSTDGKLRQLENILREVQTVVQVLRDKQEIAEAQLQLANLQVGNGDATENPKSGHLDSEQLPPPPRQPIHQSHQLPGVPPPPPLSAPPAPNAPPPPPQQIPPGGQYTSQIPPSQVPLPCLPREPYFPPQAQQTEPSHQHYQMASHQPQQPAPQHYQSAPQPPQYSQPAQPPQYSQPAQPPQHVSATPQLQPQLPHHPDESAPYMPAPQPYPPSIRQPPPLPQPASVPPPSQQFYGPGPAMYDPPASRPSSGQISGYGSSAPGFSDPYAYSGSPSHYSSGMKPSPFSSSAPMPGGSNYPRLPTAQLLPQAQPTGSSAGGPSGQRVPIDDVVDKVATMGFSRDQVRATVKKLTENGQSVDLNVVLDKLMNDGEIQPQKGWFGR